MIKNEYMCCLQKCDKECHTQHKIHIQIQNSVSNLPKIYVVSGALMRCPFSFDLVWFE